MNIICLIFTHDWQLETKFENKKTQLFESCNRCHKVRVKR